MARQFAQKTVTAVVVAVAAGAVAAAAPVELRDRRTTTAALNELVLRYTERSEQKKMRAAAVGSAQRKLDGERGGTDSCMFV